MRENLRGVGDSDMFSFTLAPGTVRATLEHSIWMECSSDDSIEHPAIAQ
ncbi:hypothetical protein CFter6_0170 [Collimonas fungivorans]|uniref:Uncharacterized protein n=1 Tax=Collimonas fungivorans TaxID=158899 RepID=A0A127P638_9BURK|nr:hypothetical protein CFter6_0170 [Collimonas fungivorans]